MKKVLLAENFQAIFENYSWYGMSWSEGLIFMCQLYCVYGSDRAVYKI